MIKGYLLNGDILIIHCLKIDEIKWKIDIKISDNKHQNDYLLWRIYQSVSKRVWKYYKDKCINIDIGEETKKEKHDNGDNILLLNKLFGNDKYENISFKIEKYKQECIGLDKYVLSQLKSLKLEWNKMYKDTDDDIEIDLNMIDDLQIVSKKLYNLYCNYKQKQSQIQLQC